MYKQSSEKKLRMLRKTISLGAFIFMVFMVSAWGCNTSTPPDPEPTFSLSVSDVTIQKLVSGSASGSSTANLSRTGGFSDAVSLSVSGLPTGVTGVFSDTSPTGNSSTLNLTVADSTATGAVTVTVTGTAGSITKTDSLTLTVNPPPAPTTITVSGRVLDLSGINGLSGVNVRIADANGNKDLVVTDGVGNFTVADVKTPYSVSAVLPASSLLPQTWAGVTRTDPKLVMFELAPTNLCTRTPGSISGNITPTVGAGNTATVTFIGEGISIQRLASSAEVNLIAGDTNYLLPVPFDDIMCQTTIAGKLVYLESNAASDFVRSAVFDVTVTTGNNSVKDISTVVVSTSTLKGAVSFPSGLANATVNTLMRFGDAYAILPNSAPVTPASGDYDIVIPNIAGVSYRTLALDGASSRWVYSDILAPGATANMTLPNLSTTVSPSGPVNTIFPTFTQTPVTGANLYISLVQGGGKTWIGSSQSTSIVLPDLPNPARLDVGGAFAWQSLNALKFRNITSVDDLLDNRLANHLYFTIFAIFNPEQIEAGSFNGTPTAFNVTP
jgi:hypothetical protein